MSAFFDAPSPALERVIERWHRYLRDELPGGLDDLLADDAVMVSPVVFTPQRGKDVVKLYLEAARATFPGDEPTEPAAGGDDGPGGSFRYTKKIGSGNTAMLEFETTMAGKFVNGVDIITCDDDGKIVEFRVMIRPLQAVNAVHQMMGAMLQRLTSSADG